MSMDAWQALLHKRMDFPPVRRSALLPVQVRGRVRGRARVDAIVPELALSTSPEGSQSRRRL